MLSHFPFYRRRNGRKYINWLGKYHIASTGQNWILNFRPESLVFTTKLDCIARGTRQTLDKTGQRTEWLKHKAKVMRVMRTVKTKRPRAVMPFNGGPEVGDIRISAQWRRGCRRRGWGKQWRLWKDGCTFRRRRREWNVPPELQSCI